MSYNTYNNTDYSPYYQPASRQNGREQYPDLSRSNGAYQSSAYQPLSAYQNNQQRPNTTLSQFTSNTGNPYSSQAYGGINGYSSGPPPDSRQAYADNNRPIDTTALGNLAYVSSLGHDQERVNYSRTPSSGGNVNSNTYETSSASAVQYAANHQRVDSSGATRQQAASSPAFDYSSNPAYGGQPSTGGSAGQSYAQYASSQSPRLPTEQRRTSMSGQLSRPASGQALHRPGSRVNSGQTQHSGHAETEQSRVQNPPPLYRPSSTGPSPSTRASGALQQPQASSTRGANQAAGTEKHINASQSLPRIPPLNQSPKVNPTPNLSNADKRASAQQSQTSTTTATDSQYPTTVDPSQVFNDVEYQKRQAVAAAKIEAARKAAEEARTTSQQKETVNNRKDGPREPHPATVSIPPSNSGDLEAVKTSQMELEMKQMIEKMRDYKSKDPNLFSQIWEQVKKGQPAPRTPSQSAPQGSVTSPIVSNGQAPDPSISQVQLPPESDLTPASIPPDLDRGRFPAQRRRRGGGKSTPSRNSSAANGDSQNTPATNISQPNREPLGQQSQNATPNPTAAGSESHVTTSTKNSRSIEQPDGRSGSSKSATAPGPAAAPPQTQAIKGGTYWPEDKKHALAEASRACLLSVPGNEGKQITVKEIHELLDQNPSYPEMCEVLETRGFLIDRGLFARQLLSAVPDLGTSAPGNSPSNPPPHKPPTPTSAPTNPPSNPPPNKPPMTSSAPFNAHTKPSHGLPIYSPALPNPSLHAPAPPPYGPFLYAPPPYPAASQMSKTQYMAPYPAHKSMSSMYNTQLFNSAMQTPETQHQGSSKAGRTDPHSGRPNVRFAGLQTDIINPSQNLPQQPPSKQDLARKRTFDEIVDLTQSLSEDDEQGPPPQRPRTNDTHKFPPTSDEPVKNISRVVAERDGENRSASPIPSHAKAKNTLDNFRYKSSGKEHLLAQDVILPLDKRRDALRRSSYDPKTIARDILIAMGKHPTMKPLNSHLEILRERFQAVNIDSDLSTFRWDLVDPGGPPPFGNDGNEADDEDGNATGHPISDQQRRRSEAVMVGPDGGPVVTPNAYIDQLRIKPYVPKRKGIPSRGGHSASNTGRRPDTGYDGFAHFVNNTMGNLRTSIANTMGSDFQTPPSTSSNIMPSRNTSGGSPSTNGLVERRTGRGRPPGAKNRNPRPDKGVPKKAATTPKQTPTAGTSILSSEPSSQPSLTPSRTQIVDAVSMPARPRIDTTPARPSGLRNAMTPPDGIAVVIPSPSPSIATTPQTAKSGRPKKTAQPVSSGRHPSSPSYGVYRCEWEDCSAELHNLATLKKHMRKHRNRLVEGSIRCLWADCHDSNAVNSRDAEGDASSGLRRLSFKSVAEWDKHVGSKHINAIAWKLGDGPSTYSSDAESSDNRSESHTRQGTPRT